MNIRDASRRDEDAIRSVVIDTLAEFGFQTETAGVDADLADIGASYGARGGVFRVLVDDDGTVVGCGGIYPLDGDTAELRKMYFRPAVRGRGFGRALLTDLVEWARGAGYRRVVLETASRLTTAIRLYERFGFTESKDPGHAGRCDRTFVLPLD